MFLDANVQIAALGIVTTIVTTSGVVFVAIINNRRERKGSAEASMEAALRERILLRDEKINELKQDKEELLAEKADLLERIRELESHERSHHSA